MGGFQNQGMWIFNIAPYFIGAIIAIMIIILLTRSIKGLRKWNYNNKQPVLTVDAKVISKRTEVRQRGNDDNNSTFTLYYVAFEVESGDRMELEMDGQEFGLLAEGDEGDLTFQGSRYKGFKRK